MRRLFDYHATRIRNLLTATPRTLALVGNGPSAQNLENEIDSHDYVVRINIAPYYGSAGVKTDVLAIINWSAPGHWMSSGHTPIHAEALASAKRIWLPMPIEEMEATKADHATPPQWPVYADFTQDVIRNLVAGRPYVKFPPMIWRDLTRDLRIFGATKEHAASTGALVLAYIVRVFPRTKVRLFGFSHEGWDGHPWSAEARWISTLSNVSYRK